MCIAKESAGAAGLNHGSMICGFTNETRPLEEHIMALWKAIRRHMPYLRILKRQHKVDVFCGYRSNSHTAGFEVDHRCLGLFTALRVPFGVSVITL